MINILSLRKVIKQIVNIYNMKIVAEASSLLVTAIRKINEGQKFCRDYPTKKIRLFLIDNNIKEAVKFIHQLYSPIKI